MFRQYKPLLTNKNFIYLWISQLLSQLTIHIMNFILLMRLFSVTGSTIATSLLWVAYSIPAIIIGSIASASVDMLDRRKILIITNLLQAVTIFLFIFVYDINIFLLYGIVLVYSLINQFYVPAELSSLPNLVKRKVYPQANSLFFITQQSMLILGFGVAGLLNQALGFEKSLVLCSTFVLLASVSVFFLPKMPVKDKIPHNFEDAFFKFFKKIYEGYIFIKGNNIILAPFLLLLVVYVCSTIVVINVLVIAQDIFIIPLNATGLYIVVPAGIGAAIGTLTVPRLIKFKWRKKRIIDIALIILSIALFTIALIVPQLGGLFKFIVSVISVAALGAGFVAIFIPAQTLLQENTPVGLRGRVFGNFWFLTTVVSVIPILFSGAIAELFGISALLLLICALTISLSIIIERLGTRLIIKGYSLK